MSIDQETHAHLGVISLRLLELNQHIVGLQRWTMLLFAVQLSIAVKLWFFP